MEKQSLLYSLIPETVWLLGQFRAKHKIMLSVLPSSLFEKNMFLPCISAKMNRKSYRWV